MINIIKIKIYQLLRRSEKIMKTDMVYLAKGAFWLTIGSVAASTSAFILSIAFANLLPKETYGIYKYVLSVAGVLAIPTLAGIDTSVIRSIALGRDRTIFKALKVKLKWSSISTLIGMIVATYYFFNDESSLAIAFVIVALFVPAMDSFAIYLSFLNGKKDFKKTTKYNIVTKLAATFAMIIVLYFNNTIHMVLLAYFLPYTALRILFYYLSTNKVPTDSPVDDDAIRYGKHLSVLSILSMIAAQLDKLLLWHFLGAAQLAVYTFAQAPISQIKGILKSTKTLSMPKFSLSDTDTLKKTLFQKVFKFFLLILLIVTIFIISLPFLFRLIYPQYLDSIIFAQVYSLILLTYPTAFFSYALTAQMKQKQLYKINIYSNIIKIVLLVVLLPTYGIWGAILALLGSNFSSSVFETYYFYTQS